MLSRSTLLHLRIPFSVFLMPVFCFAAAVWVKEVSWWEYLGVWAVLHLFLYPASNGYNSYYDRDEGSIGGLEHPPEVKSELLRTALLFDGLALLFGLFFGWKFVLMLLLYGLVSKAYSHPAIRLKKYPITSALVVSFFQGAFTFALCVAAFEPSLSFDSLLQKEILYPALLSSVLLLGSYPMTQIYQHEEDANRGDRTLSLLLGLRGTFCFTATVFALATLGFFFYFQTTYGMQVFLIFQAFLVPVLLYFAWWFYQTWQNPAAANFKNTMRLNQGSSLVMIAFFTLLAFV